MIAHSFYLCLWASSSLLYIVVPNHQAAGGKGEEGSFPTSQLSRALQSWDLLEQPAYKLHPPFRSPLILNEVHLLNLTGTASSLFSLF